jgi:hypothetical protein
MLQRLRQKISELPELLEKEFVLVGVIVFFVTLISFGFGYVAGRDWHKAQIVIEDCSKN